MEPHPYHRAIIAANEADGRPYFHQLTPADARALLSSGIAAAPPAPDIPPLDSVKNTCVEGPNGPVPVRIYTPKGAVIGTCVFFHGGGWVIGDLDLTDATCRRLAGWTPCRIVSVDYRMAPEFPFPGPLDDCWAAVQWADRRYPGNLVVAGESAGGNLAAVCALRARGAGAPGLGQLLAYPVVDHDLETASYREVGGRNWLLSTADMRWFWDHYCPAVGDRNNPEVSPLRAETTAGLAPAMVLVGELDPLRDEGLAYARRLAEGGVSVSVRFDASMVHGYLSAAAAVPAAREALTDAARWLRARLDTDMSLAAVDDGGTAIDRFYAALSSGDLDTALDCLTPDAPVWHCFDGVAQDREESLAAWKGLVAAFPERAFFDARRRAIAGGGYVQQHVMKGRRISGEWVAWPICVVVQMRGDRIARIDEYIDRAGMFDLASIGAATAPGA